MISDNFNRIVELVIAKSPFQKKKLRQYLEGREITFFEEAELFAVKYSGYLDSQDIPLDYAVSSYLEMCQNMMKCQIEFMKTQIQELEPGNKRSLFLNLYIYSNQLDIMNQVVLKSKSE